ncbi:DUF6378 domain-containing protein [Nocardia sp. NPDC055002]
MTVLQEAESLINGDRAATYGDARESFNRIAGLWSAYLGTDVTALDVTNLMVLLKVSRTKGSFHRDSYVDIGGYAGLGERLQPDPEPAPAVTEPATVEDRVEFLRDLLRVPEPARRSWARIQEVPVYVTVQDNEGDYWRPIHTGLGFRKSGDNEFIEWGRPGPSLNERYGPFKEVV